MSTMHGTRIMAICAMAVGFGFGVLEQVSAEPATPESVAEAISGLDAQASADIVVQALQGVLDSEMSDAEKREMVIAITAKSVATAGAQSAAMMAAVVARVPPVWVPVIVATSVVASGDNSPAVATAMVGALEGNADLQAAARAAAAVPTTALQPAEVRIIRTIAAPAPVLGQAPLQNADESPDATFIQPAEKYSGQ